MSERARIALEALWPAATVSAIVMAIALPWLGGRKAPGRGQWAPPLALGLGALATMIQVTNAWPSLKPHERWHWLLPMALAACVIGVTGSLVHRAIVLRIAAALALGGAMALMLHPLATTAQPLAWRLGLGVLVILLWFEMEPLADRRAGPALPIALWIAFGGLSLVLEQSRFALLSLCAAGAATSAAVIAVAAFVRPGLSLARGGVYVAAALLASMATVGWLYNRSDVPLACFILPVVAPAGVWSIEFRWAKPRLSAWQGLLLAAVATALPVAIAVILAINSTAADDPGY